MLTFPSPGVTAPPCDRCRIYRPRLADDFLQAQAARVLREVMVRHGDSRIEAIQQTNACHMAMHVRNVI